MARWPNQTISERFWNMVDVKGPDDCWEWKGYRHKNYGRFRLNGRTVYSHRVAWELTNGPIPDGLHLLHKCDNPPCNNPRHHFLGTNLDNSRDRDIKGRGADHRGEKHGRAKLVAEQVLQLRALGETVSPDRLARIFNISRWHVGSILDRKAWKHI